LVCEELVIVEGVGEVNWEETVLKWIWILWPASVALAIALTALFVYIERGAAYSKHFRVMLIRAIMRSNPSLDREKVTKDINSWNLERVAKQIESFMTAGCVYVRKREVAPWKRKGKPKKKSKSKGKKRSHLKSVH